MKKFIAFTSFISYLIFFNSLTALSQGPPDPCPDPSLNDCPIDSNLFILIIAAVFLAARKVYVNRNISSKILLHS